MLKLSRLSALIPARRRGSRAAALVAAGVLVGVTGLLLSYQPAAEAAKAAPADPNAPPPPKFSKPAQKLLAASEKAFAAQDFAGSLQTAREALAIATLDDDKRYSMRFIYRAAISLKDWNLAVSSLKDYLASGLAAQDEVGRYTRLVAQIHAQEKQYEPALEWYQKYLTLAGPAAQLEDVDTAASIAAVLKQWPVCAQIVEQARTAHGDDKIDERLWLRLNLAYYRMEKNVERRVPMTQLLVRYQKPTYFNDYLLLLQDTGADDRTMVNAMRYGQARGLFSKAGQYLDFAERLLNQGAPAEALDVLDQGTASGVMKKSDTSTSLYEQARPAAAEDRRLVPGLDREARAGKNGEADVKLGLAYLGLKQNEKAVEAITRGLTPERVARVKRVDEAHLLLGIAQYKLGQLDAARASFEEAAKDARLAEVAKLWISATLAPPPPPAAPAVPAAPPAPPAPPAAPKQ